MSLVEVLRLREEEEGGEGVGVAVQLVGGRGVSPLRSAKTIKGPLRSLIEKMIYKSTKKRKNVFLPAGLVYLLLGLLSLWVTFSFLAQSPQPVKPLPTTPTGFKLAFLKSPFKLLCTCLFQIK